MRFDIRGVLIDAWDMWRVDRDVLLRLAGPFLFLPQLALVLLTPPMPTIFAAPEATEAEQRALLETASAWLSAYGGWYLAAGLLLHFGSLAMLRFYVLREDVGMALRGATGLLPRYLLAMILVGIPLGAGVVTIVLLLPALYVLGRLVALGPVIAGEQPIGVRAALARSWRLSRGHGLVLAGLVSLPLVASALCAAPFTLLANWARTASPNPLVIALAEAGGTAVTTLALILTVLTQVAAYRRLRASTGI